MKANSLAYSLALGGATLASTAAFAVLRLNGVISGETADRAVGVVIGLMVVVYANFVPKQISNGNPAIQRFIGWTFVIAYLAYAAIWAFAPMSYTAPGSVAVGIAAMVIAFVYCRLKRTGTAA